MPVDSVHITQIEVTAPRNDNWQHPGLGRTTLTIYTNPQAIVHAQISIAQTGDWGSVKIDAFIPSFRTFNGTEVDLQDHVLTLQWFLVQAITFELNVQNWHDHPVTVAAGILLVHSSN